MPGRVSVIVVLYNGRRYIDRCLASVRAQTGVELELIVVDNASTDGGAEHVALAFPTAKLVRSAENLGYAGGINRGLEHATGSYIAPLNMDTEVAPDWLAPMVEFLEQHPRVGAVTPMILIDQDRGRVNATGGSIHITGLSFCKGLNRPAASVPRAPFPVPGVSGASFVIRRERLEAMGGAPAECFMGNDDVVLSWVLRLMGDDIYCVPASVVYHRYHLTLDPGKLYLVERNRLELLLSALELRTLLALAPLHVAMEAAILGYCVMKGPDWIDAKLRAVHDVWTRRAGLRDRRARLQRLRAVSDRTVLAALEKTLPLDQLLTISRPTPPRD